MSIELATIEGLATFLDERLRASYLLEHHSMILPTTHGYDELLPFWYKGDEGPGKQDDLKRSRPREDGAPEAPFLVKDIMGGGPTNAIGCGYMTFEIVDGGNPEVVRPGVLSYDIDQPIDFKMTFSTPAAQSSDRMAVHYTDAALAFCQDAYVGREFFDAQFPPGEGVLFLEQLQPVNIPKTADIRGTHVRRTITVPMIRRASVVQS